MATENLIPQKGVSVPTLRRLPLYLEVLKRLAEQNKPYVSCTQIADELKLVPIQVRKDLEVTSGGGKPKVGYSVPELLKAIEDYLGWNNTADALLVGAGNLGSALLGYQGFEMLGLNIVAAFDLDPRKIGTGVGDKKIMSLDRFEALAKRMKIHIGILTVPAGAAQATADLMLKSGIQAIWNFAPTRIKVPDGIIVQHENLASSLAVLSKKLQAVLRPKKK